MSTKTKKSIKKVATKKAAKRKDPNKSKAAIGKKKNDALNKQKKDNKGKSINSRIRELIIEEKWSDEEIFSKIEKEFPGKIMKMAYISIKRWDLKQNGGKVYEKLVMFEGKLTPASKLPQKPKAKKYTEEDDPLKKVAGINVHNKKVKKSVKRKAAKKATKKVASGTPRKLKS